jgi:hypothetical protein
LVPRARVSLIEYLDRTRRARADYIPVGNPLTVVVTVNDQPLPAERAREKPALNIQHVVNLLASAHPLPPPGSAG